jgi:outer membrane receptor for ferrienterochelin and colicin
MFLVTASGVVAQVASEEAGLQLQRTSTAMAGIFVRGLTGNKVNVFVDGVRNSTSAQRGGVDSHAAVTRFLGVPSTVLMPEHLPDTGFTQYGGRSAAGDR